MDAVTAAAIHYLGYLDLALGVVAGYAMCSSSRDQRLKGWSFMGWILNFLVYLGCVLLIPVFGLGVALLLFFHFITRRWPFD